MILSNPPEALITLDGTYTGETTPSVLTDITGGSHTLTLSREGFGVSEKEILLTDDSEIRFDLSPGTYGLNKLKFEGYVKNGYDEGIGGVYVTSYPEGGHGYIWTDGTPA
ncbi:PEGA domain-containing protein [Methanogenium cariaci]|uniref:PEGA domain-containing protein n=1 Tax=Methanogenium cariaci TaxID=2197 RepID=UPI000783E6EB|nr:PEGA domain-containing protein [Methanogenium cariaci]